MQPALIRRFSFGVLASVATAHAAEGNWFDRQHQAISNKLNRIANYVDGWFDRPDPENPASANLRLMLDHSWNRYDGYLVKPRIRAKVRLPALKRKFSLVLGDEDLDNQSRDKHELHRNYTPPSEDERKYNSKQTRNDNSSLAIRHSDQIKRLGIDTDLDLGLRHNTDLFVRAKASKTWQLTERFSSRFEQIYRFGIKSRHYIRTNIEFKFADKLNRSFNNHLYYQYTHSTDQKKHWGNSTYRQHNYANFKQLNYGFNFGGEVKNKQFNINFYGPFVNWRQPILQKWLYIQPEINFYNNRSLNRKHTLGASLRIEMVF